MTSVLIPWAKRSRMQSMIETYAKFCEIRISGWGRFGSKAYFPSIILQRSAAGVLGTFGMYNRPTSVRVTFFSVCLTVRSIIFARSSRWVREAVMDSWAKLYSNSTSWASHAAHGGEPRWVWLRATRYFLPRSGPKESWSKKLVFSVLPLKAFGARMATICLSGVLELTLIVSSSRCNSSSPASL